LQAAESFAAFDTTAHTATGSYLVAKRGYIAGAKAILDNPIEWDLVRYEDYLKHSNHTLAENERYREALEKIEEECLCGPRSRLPKKVLIMLEIAKEALKQ